MIVDDDAVSVMAMQRAIAKVKAATPVYVARGGEQALEQLRSLAEENKLRPPFAILLDLNMPGMNGHEFLDEVRKDAALRRTVIFVLSSSDAPEDIAAAYNRNVAGYVLKDDQAALERTVELVDRYSRLVVMPLGEPG